MIQFVGSKSQLVKNIINITKLKTIIDDDIIDVNTKTLILAGFTSPKNPNENNLSLYNQNIKRFNHFLKKNNNFNKIIKIIFISAISVYGSEWDGKSYIANPDKHDYYSKSKLMCENLIKTFCEKKNFELTILRLPGILQKNCDRNFICRLLKNIKENKPFEINSPMNKFNNLISLNDLERFINFIHLNNLNLKSQTINLACSNPITIVKIIKLIEKKYSVTAIYEIKNNMKERVIDLSHIEKIGFISDSVENSLINF